MIMTKIDSVHIRGFRSLADVELPGLSDATVLIGANGSGKSNFIRFFDMLRWMLRRQFGEFVARYGGADDQSEEEFVKQVLVDYLRRRNVEPTPVLLGRARSTGQGGGNVTVERLTQDMVRLYPDFNAVTSLVDFYGFKDKGNRTINELEKDLHQKMESL